MRSWCPPATRPDNGAGLTEGIIGLANKGQPRRLDDWGVLKAWAWGVSRAIDYFETDKAVDAKQVGMEGTPAMARPRWWPWPMTRGSRLRYISFSGEGGAKLYRHIFGEQVGNVAGTNEYHWMAGNFLQVRGTADARPICQWTRMS